MNTEIMKMNEIFKGVITKDAYKFVRTTCYRVKTFESWRGRIDLSRKFSKEEKEALNAMVSCALIIKQKLKKKEEIDLNAHIAFIVLRLVRKSLLWDMKPDIKKRLIEKLESFEKAADIYVREELEKMTSKEFANALYTLADQLSDEDKNMYYVAKYYTDSVEFKQLRNTIWFADVNKLERDVEKGLKDWNVREYITPEFGKLITKLSWARNIIRWQGCGPTLNCNILCHMLETAIFGWFMAIELNLCDANNQYSPQQAFLTGLYHDVSELWTDDIPSVCKNKIGEADKNLRPVTEELEKEMLDDNFYPAFSGEVKDYLKNNIMI